MCSILYGLVDFYVILLGLTASRLLNGDNAGRDSSDGVQARVASRSY
jgi:hypothetical protein